MEIDGKTGTKNNNNGTPSTNGRSAMNQLGDESSWSFRNADSGEWQHIHVMHKLQWTMLCRVVSSRSRYLSRRSRSQPPHLIDFRRMTQINESSGMQCEIRQSPGVDAPTEPWVCPQCTMINPETNRVAKPAMLVSLQLSVY